MTPPYSHSLAHSVYLLTWLNLSSDSVFWLLSTCTACNPGLACTPLSSLASSTPLPCLLPWDHSYFPWKTRRAHSQANVHCALTMCTLTWPVPSHMDPPQAPFPLGPTSSLILLTEIPSKSTLVVHTCHWLMSKTLECGGLLLQPTHIVPI